MLPEILPDWSFSAAAIVTLLILVAVHLWYSYSYAPYQYFKRVGIPGPEPTILDGNCKDFCEKGWVGYQKFLADKYGPAVGFYIGAAPWMQVSDLDALKEIFINRFSPSFVNRGAPLDLISSENIKQGILQSRDDDWRRARKILTPTFSTLKIKLMEPLIQQSVDRLVTKLNQLANSGQSVDVSKVFGKYTMEVILASAFGCLIDIQTSEEEDEMTRAAAAIFSNFKEGSRMDLRLFFKWFSLFPWLKYVMKKLIRFSPFAQGNRTIVEVSQKLVTKRREESNDHQFKDLLQLMLEAHTEEVDEGDNPKGLTDREIVGHSRDFLLAGYETTSTALSFTFYLLAIHPDIQDRLREEIKDYFQEKPDSSLYDASQSLEYLDMVLNESLRLYPPAAMMFRYCSEEVTIESNSLTIPKGTTILMPIHYLHHNPELWPEPENFDPERFSPDNKANRHPFAFVPFGAGPRNCIGMKFALLEAKMAIIEVLKKYNIVRSVDTEVPLKTIAGATMTAKNGVHVLIKTVQ